MINFIVLGTVGEREREDTVFRASAEAPCVAHSLGGGARPLRLSGQGREHQAPSALPAPFPAC